MGFVEEFSYRDMEREVSWIRLSWALVISRTGLCGKADSMGKGMTREMIGGGSFVLRVPLPNDVSFSVFF